MRTQIEQKGETPTSKVRRSEKRKIDLQTTSTDYLQGEDEKEVHLLGQSNKAKFSSSQRRIALGMAIGKFIELISLKEVFIVKVLSSH